MTFLALQDDALEECGFVPATVTTAVRARFKRRINKWQRRILTKPVAKRLLRDRALTFTTTASTHTYSFPASVARMLHLSDLDANQGKLVRRDLAWLRTVDAALQTLGNPEVYVDLGRASTGLLQVQLWPTPQGDFTYRLDYTAQIADMTEDDEEPLLPLDYHEVLSLGAQHDEWRKQDDDRLAEVRADLEDRLKSLNGWLWDLADSTQERPVGWSNLGGWFPADVYLRR